jgi:arsenical pump membrane protein
MINIATWSIAGMATFGVIVRPFGWPEYVWAMLGAALLVLLGLLPLADAAGAVVKGTDVYLFLIGMMTLAELARREALFDYLAGHAVNLAGGSASRLFTIVYVVGIVVTVFLSNDATAVVLTPAVYAATRTAGVKPLPFLFICAFIANAASFVLPISNPANLVVFGEQMPTLQVWLAHLFLPSVAAIASTYIVLRWTQRHELRAPIATNIEVAPLSRGGKVTGFGIVLTAAVLLAASALGSALGLPTFVCAAVVAALVLTFGSATFKALATGISWSVLPLVAGLFVLVEGLSRSGLLVAVGNLIHHGAQWNLPATAALSGLGIGFGSNIVNNLPMGLMASSISQSSALPAQITEAMLIGVDLGPNLSVTGSLATLLWLLALRREGVVVGGWQFIKLGALVMIPALVLSLGVLIFQPVWA